MDDSVLRGKNVLVVDDEVDLREIVASELDFMGAIVDQAGNIAAADAILKQKKIDLIISDIRMPGGTGIELLQTVKARNILTPPVILITGFADITSEEAYDYGAEALLNKPFQLDELIQVSARLLNTPAARFSSEKNDPEKVIRFDSSQTLKQTPHFEIGRGGVFICIENNQKFEMGEHVLLNLSFTDTKLNAQGIVRWSKLSDQEGRLCLGLEFYYIEPESLQYLLEHWATPGLAFIPKSR